MINILCYWWKDRHTGEWNRLQNTEKDPQTYAQLIFDKGAKVIEQMVLEQWTSIGNKMILIVSHPLIQKLIQNKSQT